MIARLVPLTVALLLSVAAPAAAASKLRIGDFTLSTKVASCPGGSEQTFLPYGDPMWYAPVPGGSFEGGKAAWSLTAGARVVAGNEPFGLGPGSAGLSLAEGASADSPTFCAAATTPTLRFAARSIDGVTGMLTVSVTADGTRYLTVARLSGSGAWELTPALPIYLNYLGIFESNGRIDLTMRVTATSGSWLVDGVYIDPFKKV
jgi:hypothetical protein